MKIFAALVVLTFSLLLNSVVLAEDSTTSSRVKDSVEKRRLLELQSLKERTASRQANLKEKFASKSSGLREKFDQKIEEFQEKRETKRKELLEKLKKIKDQRKANIVERVDGNLDKINQRRTTQMLAHLQKMTDLITKLEIRIGQLNGEGKDITQATESLNLAKTAISEAQAAAQAQVTQDYTINTSTETKLKEDVKFARDNLQTDLKATHSKVVEARKSLAEAIKTIMSVKGEENGDQ